MLRLFFSPVTKRGFSRRPYRRTCLASQPHFKPRNANTIPGPHHLTRLILVKQQDSILCRTLSDRVRAKSLCSAWSNYHRLCPEERRDEVVGIPLPPPPPPLLPPTPAPDAFEVVFAASAGLVYVLVAAAVVPKLPARFGALEVTGSLAGACTAHKEQSLDLRHALAWRLTLCTYVPSARDRYRQMWQRHMRDHELPTCFPWIARELEHMPEPSYNERRTEDLRTNPSRRESVFRAACGESGRDEI